MAVTRLVNGDRFWIDPVPLVAAAEEDGEIPRYVFAAEAVYDAYLQKLLETGDVMTAQRPSDAREQRYLREIQNIGNDAVETAWNADAPFGSQAKMADRDAVLEKIRKWFMYTAYEAADAGVIALRFAADNERALRYRLWVS